MLNVSQETWLQSGILNDLSAQSVLPLLDHFSFVFDTDEREQWIGKSLKTTQQKIDRLNPSEIFLRKHTLLFK